MFSKPKDPESSSPARRLTGIIQELSPSSQDLRITELETRLADTKRLYGVTMACTIIVVVILVIFTIIIFTRTQNMSKKTVELMEKAQPFLGLMEDDTNTFKKLLTKFFSVPEVKNVFVNTVLEEIDAEDIVTMVLRNVKQRQILLEFFLKSLSLDSILKDALVNIGTNFDQLVNGVILNGSVTLQGADFIFPYNKTRNASTSYQETTPGQRYRKNSLNKSIVVYQNSLTGFVKGVLMEVNVTVSDVGFDAGLRITLRCLVLDYPIQIFPLAGNIGITVLTKGHQVLVVKVRNLSDIISCQDPRKEGSYMIPLPLSFLSKAVHNGAIRIRVERLP